MTRNEALPRLVGGDTPSGAQSRKYSASVPSDVIAAGHYDFSTFRDHAPKNLRVMRADKWRLDLRDDKKKRTFITRKPGSEFELSVQHDHEAEQFMFRTDDVLRVFKFLGYVR